MEKEGRGHPIVALSAKKFPQNLAQLATLKLGDHKDDTFNHKLRQASCKDFKRFTPAGLHVQRCRSFNN